MVDLYAVTCVCAIYAGLAIMNAICSQYAAVIVREAGEYATAQTITHEIGHT